MNQRYKNFRQYGHSRFISFLHAVPMWWIIAVAVGIGLML